MIRPRAGTIAAGLVALALVSVLVALGTWQVHRRAWKLDLIARVEARLHAAPVPAPGPAAWRTVTPADAYRRIVATGRYQGGAQALVQASTPRGAGWWVMTPLAGADGATILVNRGFVPVRSAPPAPAGPVRVTGLLRVSEPGGGFLRRNDAAHDRWYSRDTAAIAMARRIGPVAPFFIDAEAAPAPVPGQPVGGLTVVAFQNNHLVYAITWYTLAIMVVAGFILFVRGGRSAASR